MTKEFTGTDWGAAFAKVKIKNRLYIKGRHVDAASGETFHAHPADGGQAWR